jgi:hypothetical protein
MFGGVADMRTNTRTNQVFKIWLRIPSLLHYDSKLRLMNHSSLLKIGIPQEFVTLVHPAPPCGYGPDTSPHWASDLMSAAATLPSEFGVDGDDDDKSLSEMEIEPVPVAIGY